tara:strand:+ start:233 stop:1204 length:972 start_codon:yes stop_codon:yes gene_type:complete
MAVTQNTYTGNSSTNLFSLTFPYIDSTDIFVSLDGTVISTTAYSLANATQITFAPIGSATSTQETSGAPKTGVTVRIFRTTDDSEVKATFYPGSAIRANDLNDNFLQTIYSVQELVSRYLDTSNPKLLGNLDMSTYRITNMGDGSGANDAVTKSQLDAGLASSGYSIASANAAAASATAAANSATTAGTAVTDAQNFAVKPHNQSFTYSGTSYKSALHYSEEAAVSATAASSFAAKTVFFGFSRASDGSLKLDYSVAGQSTDFSTADYETDGESHWFIGGTDALHTSATITALGSNTTRPDGSTITVGSPRFALTNGNLTLSI